MARSIFPFSQPLAGLQACGTEAIFTGEGEESRQKADETAVVFDNGGGQIVVGDFARDAAQRGESVHVATGEGFEALAVSELDIEHPAVRFDQREGIQLACIARVAERTEVAPVDFESFSGRRLHADEGAAGCWLRTYFADMFLQNAVPAVVTERTQALLDDGGCDAWVLLQPFGDRDL